MSAHSVLCDREGSKKRRAKVEAVMPKQEPESKPKKKKASKKSKKQEIKK